MLALYKKITYKPFFWIIFSLLSLLGIVFAYSFFSKTFPIADLKITMDREMALQKASLIAYNLNLKPAAPYKQALSFDSESEVQNYVELEAGGPKAFGELLQENYYAPFFWRVRHFKEYDPAETEIFFKPDGTPYGFIQKISENEPGAALTEQEAEAIAHKQATMHWDINFDDYTSVEKAQEITPHGRVDHTFVYENRNKKVGQAPYRLKLVVRGDILTELKLSIKVPEAFKRKYQEMRSFNTTIALTALIIMVLLYVFGCGFIGLYYLARWHLLEWKLPLLGGIILGILSVINSINQIPFLWLHYDTAISLHQFIGYIGIRLVYQFFIYALASTLLFIVAEGLTRRAFPHHIQFLKIWTSSAGSSFEVLGRTLGGYLIVGIHLAYVIAFYYGVLHYFGWWSPSETLYDPNSLATYIPWISPIINSLSAGVLEEALFRAVPLASAALIGNRYGRKKLWIVAAFILQMVVFGAAHANYPAQPAYARLIELLIPSAIFGIAYLRFGLLPAMLSHFIYDVCWFALPIFISYAPGILFDKIMVILVSLIPLFIVIYRRIGMGTWIELPNSFYNSFWKSKPVQERFEADVPTTIALPRLWYSLVAMAGVLGFICWIVGTSFNFSTLPLVVTRTQALHHAQQLVPKTELPRTPLINLESPLELEERNQHIAIWNTAGKAVYKKLLHTYLMPPVWKVRLVHFEGALADRADEFELLITGDKKNAVHVRRMHHTLPETMKLASLSKEQARHIALKSIEQKYGLHGSELQEISAIPAQLPERIDWKFTFNDRTQELPVGQARITVEIAGQELVDSHRFIFVPEQWERAYKDNVVFVKLIETTKWLLLGLLLLVIALIFVYSLRSVHFSIKMFSIIALTLASKSFIQSFNIWPLAIAQFNTSEPFSHQAWSVVTFWLVYGLFMAVTLGLIAGLLQKSYCKSAQSNMSFNKYVLFGVMLGLTEVGLYSVITYFMPTTIPLWPTLNAGGAFLPWLSQALIMLTSFIQYTLFTLALLIGLDKITAGAQKYGLFVPLSLIILGLVVIDLPMFTSLVIWIIAGIVWAIGIWLLYYYALRHMRAAIPIMVATKKICEAIPLLIFNAFPGAVYGTILGTVIIFLYGCYWSYQLYKNK